MPLSEIEAESKEELIKKIIKHEMDKGKSQKEAVAIALEEARNRGYKDADIIPKSPSFGYEEIINHTQLSESKPYKMNGIYIIPKVVLAVEMVQNYHRQELPFLDEILPPEITKIAIFKPYEELKKIKETEVPYVEPHTRGTFLKDRSPYPSENYIQEDEIKGWIKEIKPNDKLRRMEGKAFLKISQLDPETIAKLDAGQVVDVSIGFSASFGDGGEYNGKEYLLHQREFHLGHLAGLPHDKGKCSIDKCGLNKDQDLTLSTVNTSTNKQSLTDLTVHVHLQDYVCPIKKQFYNVDTYAQLKLKAEKSPCGVLFNKQNNDHTIISNPIKEKIMMDEAEFLKQLQARDSKIDDLQKQMLSKDKTVFEDQLKDLKGELASLKNSIVGKDTEISSLKKDLADAQTLVKKIESDEKSAIIGFLTPRWHNPAELADYDLKILRSIKKNEESKDAASLSKSGMMKPSEADRAKKMNQSDQNDVDYPSTQITDADYEKKESK